MACDSGVGLAEHHVPYIAMSIRSIGQLIKPNCTLAQAGARCASVGAADFQSDAAETSEEICPIQDIDTRILTHRCSAPGLQNCVRTSTRVGQIGLIHTPVTRPMRDYRRHIRPTRRGRRTRDTHHAFR